MTVAERLLRSREQLARVIACSLPKRIRYWVTMQEIGHATRMSADIPATPVSEILKNLDAPKNIH
jgi:hypothetical protein